MNLKKTLLVILAVVLICAISVTGTLAYLEAQSDPVTNTFVAAGGGSLFEATGGITLNESPAVLNTSNGSYSLDTSAAKVTANSYSVLPGTTVPKDPTITITGKNEVPAYLYVEVVDNTGANITWTPATGWTALNVTAPHTGGTVYVWSTVLTDDATVTVLAGNQVTIGNVEDLGLGDSGKTMQFYAYLAQSTIGANTDQATVFTTCFGSNP